jgi:hypothetical protein
VVRRARARGARGVASVLDRAGRACLPEPRRRRLPRARRARARARGARDGARASTPHPTARRSGPGSSTSATRCSGSTVDSAPWRRDPSCARAYPGREGARLGIELGDQSLRRDDPVALLDPVAEELVVETGRVDRDVHPARVAEPVPGRLDPRSRGRGRATPRA